jgi:hypothetical protein
VTGCCSGCATTWSRPVGGDGRHRCAVRALSPVTTPGSPGHSRWPTASACGRWRPTTCATSREDDVFLADVLRCVRQQVPLGARHLDRVSAEGWFTTAAEQARRFAERPDLLVNAHEVAVSCEVDLGIGEVVVPRLTGMADEVAAGELHRRCWQGVADRYARITPKVRERLERELAMVDRLGLHDYFLAVGDVVASIRRMGVLAACRGSAAGSWCATRCGSPTSTRWPTTSRSSGS